MDKQTKDEKVELLREKRNAVHKEIEEVYKKFKKASIVFQKYEREWSDLRKEFLALDYELAMIDGRYKVLPTEYAKNVKRAKDEKAVTVDLNKAQIVAIASALGVDLEFED